MSTGEALERDLESRDPDVKLMLQVRDDVSGAFEVLVQRYQDRLLGILAHLVGRVDEAENLAQEVFLRIYKARKGYRPRTRFSTWLFTIANNLAMNHLRGQGRNPAVGVVEDSPSGSQTSLHPGPRSTSAPGATASAAMHQTELGEIVRAALDRLSDDQRMAVLLSRFEEMNYAEIAEVMGRTEPAVKSLMARARSNLREQLEPYVRNDRRTD